MKVKRLKPYSNKRIVVETDEKPLFYRGREIEFIDYTETTAGKNFAEVRFKGSNELYIIDINKI